MTNADTFPNHKEGLSTFWLLIPKWLRRVTRHCEECGGTNFLLDKTPSAPPWTSAERARRIKLLTAQSLLDGFRTGAVRR